MNEIFFNLERITYIYILKRILISNLIEIRIQVKIKCKKIHFLV